MTIERRQEILQEGNRRLQLWLKHSTFEEMTAYGSLMRFDMSLGLRGYPFVMEDWMKDKGFNTFVTQEEYDSVEYNEIIISLFDFDLDVDENEIIPLITPVKQLLFFYIKRRQKLLDGDFSAMERVFREQMQNCWNYAQESVKPYGKRDYTFDDFWYETYIKDEWHEMNLSNNQEDEDDE